MELNLEGRIDLRNRINEKLKDIEFNPEKRIKLPNDKLEVLLFEKYKDLDGNTFKKIRFITDNLCKLDLSNLSFDTVSFNNIELIDLSNTNANINFKNSYEFKQYKLLSIKNVDFKNVDLSKNDFEELTTECKGIIYKCNLSNTGIKLLGWKRLDIVDCDLSYIDLKGANLYLEGAKENFKIIFNDDEDDEIVFKNCNLSYTGINIANACARSNPMFKNSIKDLVDKGYLDGCYINGTLINNKNEKVKKRNELLNEYNLFKAKEINETLDMIDKQLTHDGGRQVSKTKILNNREQFDHDTDNFYGNI